MNSISEGEFNTESRANASAFFYSFKTFATVSLCVCRLRCFEYLLKYYYYVFLYYIFFHSNTTTRSFVRYFCHTIFFCCCHCCCLLFVYIAHSLQCFFFLHIPSSICFFLVLSFNSIRTHGIKLFELVFLCLIRFHCLYRSITTWMLSCIPNSIIDGRRTATYTLTQTHVSWYNRDGKETRRE